MEPFDIKVEHQGQSHEFHVVPHAEDPEFELFQGEISLGKLSNKCDERGDYWCSEELTDNDLLEKIGDRIEKYER